MSLNLPRERESDIIPPFIFAANRLRVLFKKY